jgi:hypothetical protein
VWVHAASCQNRAPSAIDNPTQPSSVLSFGNKDWLEEARNVVSGNAMSTYGKSPMHSPSPNVALTQSADENPDQDSAGFDLAGDAVVLLARDDVALHQVV